MTEPVKMWAVVRDDGSVRTVFEDKNIAEVTARTLPVILSTYTVKPCEVRIIEDES